MSWFFLLKMAVAIAFAVTGVVLLTPALGYWPSMGVYLVMYGALLQIQVVNDED